MKIITFDIALRSLIYMSHKRVGRSTDRDIQPRDKHWLGQSMGRIGLGIFCGIFRGLGGFGPRNL